MSGRGINPLWHTHQGDWGAPLVSAVRCTWIWRPTALDAVAPFSQVLEGLASAERGQVRMSLDEGVHPVAVRTRVVAQRPADRLADEELRVLLVGLDDVGEQVEVRIGLVLELAEDGAARTHMSGSVAHTRMWAAAAGC